MATLEERVAALEERLAMQEGLRASMDDDLSSVAANTKANNLLLQALSITQSEHTKKLDKQGEQLDSLVATMAKHSTALDGIAALLAVLVEREGGEDPAEGAS